MILAFFGGPNGIGDDVKNDEQFADRFDPDGPRDGPAVGLAKGERGVEDAGHGDCRTNRLVGRQVREFELAARLGERHIQHRRARVIGEGERDAVAEERGGAELLVPDEPQHDGVQEQRQRQDVGTASGDRGCVLVHREFPGDCVRGGRTELRGGFIATDRRRGIR